MRSDYEKIILRFLKFHSYARRGMTLVEIGHHLRSCGLKTPLEKIKSVVDGLLEERIIKVENGFFRTSDSAIDLRRAQDVLYDKKWKKFLRISKLFAHIPFVRAAFGAGSMSLGNVDKNSDFDVILLTTSGRIFGARIWAAAILGMLGVRRGGQYHRSNDATKDKVCLNHFITEEAMKLTDPRNFSFHELYYNVVPIYGDQKLIASFFSANDWVGSRPYTLDRRYVGFRNSWFKTCVEFALGGYVGNVLEKFFKKIQIARITKKIRPNKGYGARLIVHDNELEFHPDREKFELWDAVVQNE